MNTALLSPKLAALLGSKKHEAIVHEDFSDAARILAERIVALIESKPSATIGLATGDTPKPVYAHIINTLNERKASGRPVDVSRVQFVALDEYKDLPPDHPNSFAHYLWENLLKPIGANPLHVHLPPNTSAHGACEKYEAHIKSLAPVDLWIVGIGQNGHIGFNEPGEKRFSHTREVTLRPETLAANSHHFSSAEAQPTHAITVGLQTLMEHTQAIALIASGAHKHKPLSQLLSGHYNPHNPATTLQFHPDITVYADSTAMGQLKGWSRSSPLTK